MCNNQLNLKVIRSIALPKSRPWFLSVCSTGLSKTLGKREIARHEQSYKMSQFFKKTTATSDKEVTKAIAIPQVFSENSRAKNVKMSVTRIFSFSHNVFCLIQISISKQISIFKSHFFCLEVCCGKGFNSLPNDTFLGLFKSIAFADNKTNGTEKLKIRILSLSVNMKQTYIPTKASGRQLYTQKVGFLNLKMKKTELK